MHDPAVESSYPKTAVAIAQHPSASNLFHTSRQLIRLRLSINKPMNRTAPADEQCAVLVFTEALDAVRLAGEWVKSWWTRFPLPQTIQHAHPQIAFTVLVQVEYRATEAAIVSKALNASTPNRTKSAKRNCRSTNPDRSFTILENLENVTSGEFRAVNKLKIQLEGSSWFAGGRHWTALTPSKRNNPNSVPSQR
jgi:hypothetical protein